MSASPLVVLSALRRKGVLGMNRRNIAYISRYNKRSLFPLVDNKLQTKRLALDYGVTVPELIAVIDNQHDVSLLEFRLGSRQKFCIKPAKGSGGKGILVVRGREDEYFLRSNGQRLSLADLQRHVSNILAGLFSLGGAMDVAVIESLIEVDDDIGRFSHEGVPDLRVIVFRGVPVMAMMRLACSASQGKANLHQGAVGVGIDIASGCAVHAVQLDRPIDKHPDTQLSLAELQIPSWRKLMVLACACADMTGLGYLGVDLVIDKHTGPALLELNARPGLSIQIANNAGLLPRLRQVEKVPRAEHLPVPARVEFSETHFATGVSRADSTSESDP